MIAIHFGHLCFNKPSGEQSILIVVASKKDYPSMDSFVTNALKYLESHKNFCDNWTEMYKNRVYSPIDEEEKKWMKSRLEEMNQRISIRTVASDSELAEAVLANGLDFGIGSHSTCD